MRGRFVWYELMTTDPAAAKGFYTKVVGWGTQDWPGSNPPYWMWIRGEAPVGGLMQLPEEARKGGAPPHWLAYVSVPDVDQSVEQAKGMGAMVHVPPTEIPEIGRFAVLADPQGAAFAVFKALSHGGIPDKSPQTGDFSWHELVTTDLDAAFRFYSALFGWEKTTAMDMGPMGVYQMYGVPGHELGGMFNRPPDIPAPPHWMLYVKVDDIDQSTERVKSAGGQILNGPMEVPGGDWIVQCMDPQGAAFSLHAAKKD
ncbi:MAG: VOC family protein [Vicinamibacterales bacterium]